MRLMARPCLWLVLLVAGGASAASIAVEHSLDGGKSFVPAGSITLGAVRHGATAVLERPPLSAEQQEQLSQLIASNGLYRLRLPSALAGSSSASQPVSTSFPARCLAAAAADGGLALDLLDARHVAGIAVSVPCTREAPAAAAGMLPSSQALHLRLPLEAPDVLQLVVPGQQGAAAAAAATGTADLQAGAARQQAQGQAQQAAGQEQRAPAQGQQVQGKAAGKGQVKEEEKTWLQKNWMLVMPLGFILMNLLGGGNQAQRGGGGAPVRAVPARR